MTPQTITYLDTSVIVAAAHGTEDAHLSAMHVLSDPQRVFIASDFVRIETVPHARYNKYFADLDFYEEYLRSVTAFVSITPELIARGIEVVAKFGIGSMDALHLAAAELGGADEFVTAEKPTKPFFRATSTRTRIVGIHP